MTPALCQGHTNQKGAVSVLLLIALPGVLSPLPHCWQTTNVGVFTGCSGTSESALASGLKRDWQQAINMDPKELEEALKTVLMDDLPSPRFVSDLMDPKH